MRSSPGTYWSWGTPSQGDSINGLSSNLVLFLLEVHDIVRDVSSQAEVDHPVHEVEGDEHDGEDDSAVLVDITGPHPEYPGGRVGGQDGGRGGEERGPGVGADVPVGLVPGQRVHTVVEGAGQHTAGVEPHTGLRRVLVQT